MKLYKQVTFWFQAITIGLALAFVAMLLWPDLISQGRRVVQVFEDTTAPATAPASTAPVSYAAAVENAAPAVVNIYTLKTVITRIPDSGLSPFGRGPQKREETSLGSGVILSDDGYILTNYHVIEGAEAIAVALNDGRSVDATLVGSDPESDLAVLKVALDDLPTIMLGESEQLRVGDVVLAIGNPFGVGQTVTMGIVSATGRKELGINTFENFIQTDAAINPGNSGGALINARGALVGINTAIFSQSGGSEGIGFAIPVNLAREVMTQIIEHGRVRRGWLGIEIQPISPELAESFGLPDTRGILIAGVLREGPAAQAGIRPGDVITHINDDPVGNERTILETITAHMPGETIRLQAIRQGAAIEFEARVDERPLQQR